MALALAILGWTLFTLAILVGLTLDLVGLFGNWIILLAVGLAAWATGFEHFGVWTLLALLVLAVAGEVLETLAAGAGAARFGGGRGAIVAALVGCIAGAIIGTPFLLIIGTVVGACIGAFAAATLYEFIVSEKSPDDALRVGFGAALGKVAGLFAKTFVGFAMLLIAALTF